MALAIATQTAREYARSSKGRGHRSRSTQDQHTQNLSAEAEHGPWTWGKPYTDTGSAWHKALKPNDDFLRMVADMRSGAFGPAGTVLVLWEISRLTRKTLSGVEVVDLCEERGYLIHVTSLDRTFNPSNYSDRDTLITGIKDAEKEARLLSARTLRGVNSAIDAVNDDGEPAARPHGRIPFGFRRTYELIDGRPRPVSQEADPIEGPFIVELFERVAGWNGRRRESIRSVEQDWLKRDIVSREGVPFSRQNLAQMLKRKAYVGIRVHTETDPRTGEKIVTERPGNWEPLVEPELFDAVQRILADPSRKSTTSNIVKHVLTGVLRCDVCGGKVSLRPGGKAYDGRLVYRCYLHDHFTIDKEQTDGHVLNELMTYLFLAPASEVPEPLADDGDSELSSARSELARLRGELDELEATPAPKTARARRRHTADMEELETDIAALEAKLSALAAPDPLSEVFETGPGAADRWVAADIAVQRTVAAIVLGPRGALGQPRIRRVADSTSPAVRDRVRWHKAEVTAA
ncbi:recombinase family protein [Streptomyces cyaneochromogenes]|uniref:Recombinase family protein n=1 Tax=Streptomyces cyaneochromogenes TaxID=2496836 RepID=A0A3Q9EZM3_9ACTN|nr:recombinase family protein [Streptomyces cyaneochromogenes]AZQ39643.1 recombinase family protein [Streptomyces cyaneochromogenes]